VPPGFLRGAYVSCDAALAQFEALDTGLDAVVDPHLFFR
jgi:hypothetical protein